MPGAYKCARCKRKVEIEKDYEEKFRVRCIYCGHHILFKERGGAIKTLRAR